MIQHTMQEIADFTGEYPEKDKDGAVNLHPSLPVKKYGYFCDYWDCELPAINITRFVSDAATHDWTVLVEPHKDNNHDYLFCLSAIAFFAVCLFGAPWYWLLAVGIIVSVGLWGVCRGEKT